MDLNSLLLGLVFALAISAVKAGAGLHRFLEQKRGLAANLAVICGLSLVYFGLFAGSFLALRKIDLIWLLERLQRVLATGLVHFLFAAGLLVGAFLMLRMGREAGGRLRWLALAAPCPGAIATIFLSTALAVTFAVSYVPDLGHWVVVGAALNFLVVTFGAALGFSTQARHTPVRPESMLGGGAIILAAYFLVSFPLMPELGDLAEIYGLAAYQGKQQSVQATEVLALLAVGCVFFILGFVTVQRRIRRQAH